MTRIQQSLVKRLELIRSYEPPEFGNPFAPVTFSWEAFMAIKEAVSMAASALRVEWEKQEDEALEALCAKGPAKEMHDEGSV